MQYCALIPVRIQRRLSEAGTFIEVVQKRQGLMIAWIIESTSPVGTTDKMKQLVYAERPELEGAI